MKDLIAKLHLDANCALGAIWMHIDAQAARITELEAQIAASADTNKLRESILNIKHGPTARCGEGDYSTDAYWQDGFYAALEIAADVAASTALQSPVREVPEGWKLVPIEPTIEMIAAFAFKGDIEMAIGHGAIFGEACEDYAEMLAKAPLPAAPVQEPKP